MEKTKLHEQLSGKKKLLFGLQLEANLAVDDYLEELKQNMPQPHFKISSRVINLNRELLIEALIESEAS